MKKLMFFIALSFFAMQTVWAQNKLTGIVKDSETQKALAGVIVEAEGITTQAKTNSEGKFSITLADGDHTLTFSAPEYRRVYKSISVNSDADLGTILMQTDQPKQDRDIVIQLSEDDLDSEFGGMETNISGALHSSDDVFLSTAGYNFGPLRFNIRGYESRYTGLHMNGVQTNDPESGRAIWAYWGGLNDAVRSNYSEKGITENSVGFGGIGGYTSIDTRASKIRTGTKLTYSYTNRNYNHRAMFIHSTGMMKNGLAVAVSGSRRYAQEGYTDGTFYDGYAYFGSIENKISDKHTLGLVAFGSPTKSGGRSGTTQEVYDLTSTTYNPNWGWQDGRKRNARITDGHSPMGIFTHYWNMNRNTSLETSFSYMRGKYNRTSLNWYNATDPRPDYYRYLPSYMTSQEAAELRAEEFRNDERQLDWNAIYQTNLSNFHVTENADGIAGNTYSGNRSEYIIEDRRDENNQYTFNTNFRSELSENIEVTAGAQYKAFYSRKYKTLEDLLGGDYFVDIDKYAERDLIGDGVADNDINHPNHIVDTIGEVFGNDYNATILYGQAWAQASYNLRKFSAYLGGYGSYTNYWRTGNMQNGKFPENSLGDSEKFDFINYGTKIGVKYKVLGFHHFHADAAYLTKAPYFENAFVSPRTRNQTVSNLKDEKIMTAQAGYKLQSPKLKATFDVFYTEFKDQTEVRSFYFDGFRNFVNFVMTDINKTHQGIELGIEYEVLTGLSVHGVASLGYYRWTSRPNFSVYVDNSSETLYEDETAYVKNFLVAGTPQTALSAGVQYFAPKYWWIGVDANYMDHRYLQFSALTRTVDALEGMERGTEEFKELISQEKLPESFMLNAFVGKSFRFDYKYYLSISLNVSNVLDNRSIMTGGYEQGRIDASFENLDQFPPKYFYYSGLQYYLNINFRF
jgi:hypothetical protein